MPSPLTPEQMKMLEEHAGREFVRNLCLGPALLRRIEEAKLDPDDFDLNPHLQVRAVADKVVADVRAEGFEECTREEVLLAWVTRLVFHRMGEVDRQLALRARVAAGVAWHSEVAEDQEPEVRRILRECADRIDDK